MNSKIFSIITILLILTLGTIFLVTKTKNPEPSQNNLEIDNGIAIDNFVPETDSLPALPNNEKDLHVYEEKIEAVEDGVSGLDINNIKNELSFPDNNLDTSDWEVYYTKSFSDDIKFKVTYPKGWIVKSHGENQQGPNAGMVVFDKYMGEGSDNGINLETQRISVEEYISKTASESGYEIVKVNNTYGFIRRDESGKFIATSTILSNKNNDKLFSFYIIGPDLHNPSDPKYYLKVFEKILLSFTLVK